VETNVATLLAKQGQTPDDLAATLAQLKDLLRAGVQTDTAFVTRQQSAPAEKSRTQLAQPPSVNETALQDALTQVIREELQTLHVACPPQHEQTGLAEPPPQVTAEANHLAYERAYDIVTDALATGRWTDEDVQAIHQTLGALTPQQQHELFDFLRVAVSNEEIVLDIRGPLF
jgi:hypothetical protein